MLKLKCDSNKDADLFIFNKPTIAGMSILSHCCTNGYWHVHENENGEIVNKISNLKETLSHMTESCAQKLADLGWKQNKEKDCWMLTQPKPL